MSVKRQAGGHQHRRPVDAVRLQNVLGDKMLGTWPEIAEEALSLKGRGTRVVEQRIEPHVGDEVRVERQLDAPSEASLRSRDRQILKRLAQKAEDLVAIALGANPIRMIPQVVEKALLVATHAEEVVFLLDEARLDLVVRALAVDELLLRVEALTARAVEPRILPEVDVAARVNA